MSELPAKETEPFEELNTSDEFHDVESGDSDDSFVSSLEQMTGDDDASNDNDETLKAESSNENCSMSMDEVDDDKSDGDTINEMDMEKEIDLPEVNDTNVRINSTKITFYCESVNKLMADSGDECDEIIQEMTPCCVTVE